MTDILGIDVSGWQKNVDYAAVKAAGYRFVIVKASEGTGASGARAAHVAGTRAAGLPVGAYHFAKPDGADAQVEAHAFLDAIREFGEFDLPHMLDLEQDHGMTKAALTAWAVAWVEVIRGLGHRAMLYTGANFEHAHIDAKGTVLTSLPLVIAAYPHLPASVAPWTRATVHQFTGTGKVPGVAGNCDVDRFLGDEAAFAAFCGKAPESASCPWIEEMVNL